MKANVDDLFDSDGTRRYGEVIETSSVRIWVECDRLNDLPPLGSVVSVATEAGEMVFAIVSFCETTGIDSSRRAVRRGSDEVRNAEVYRRHPELTRVLRSTFEAVLIAFQRRESLYCLVPPIPPPLHYSVDAVSLTQLQRLSDRLDYLTMLARYQGEVAAEQIVISHLRATFEARGRDASWLDRAAGEIGRLYSSEYDRLLPILEAIDPGEDRIGLRVIR
jgi:hypothetical protein